MFWYVFFNSEKKTATFSSDPKTRKIVQRKYKSAMVKEFSYFEFFFWPGWSWPSLIFEAMMKSSFWYLDKGSVGRVKRQKLQDFYHLGPRGGAPLSSFFCLNIYIKILGQLKHWFEFSGHLITKIIEIDSANDCSETKISKSWALMENNVLLLFFIRLLTWSFTKAKYFTLFFLGGDQTFIGLRCCNHEIQKEICIQLKL